MIREIESLQKSSGRYATGELKETLEKIKAKYPSELHPEVSAPDEEIQNQPNRGPDCTKKVKSNSCDNSIEEDDRTTPIVR